MDDALFSQLGKDLIEGIDKFIGDSDVPPTHRMNRREALNLIVRDWQIGHRYLPLPPAKEETH